MKILTLTLVIISFFSAKAQNLIKNPSFDDGISEWELKVQNKIKGKEDLRAKFALHKKPDAATHRTSAKVRMIYADEEGKYDFVYISQKVEGLKKNKKYFFKAWVRSTISRQDKVLCQVLYQKPSGSKTEYVNYYSSSHGFKGNGKWHEISFMFNTSSKGRNKVDLKNIEFRMGFSGRIGTYYIDSFSIERI